MTPTEHVLAVVEEECGEVAEIALRMSRAASKALRFGPEDGYPGTERTNRSDLVREFNDLLGSLELMQEQGIELPGLFDRAAIDAKKARVRQWMEHARSLGRLSEPEAPESGKESAPPLAQARSARKDDMVECTWSEHRPDDCPYCAGSMCARCGAGSVGFVGPRCEHGSFERHELPRQYRGA
jgi:hypothetical protein